MSGTAEDHQGSAREAVRTVQLRHVEAQTQEGDRREAQGGQEAEETDDVLRRHGVEETGAQV